MNKTLCVCGLLLAVVCSSPVSLFSAQNQDKKEQTEEKVNDTRLPEPGSAKAEGKTDVAAAVDPNTFVLGAEDIINIRVWREADVSGDFAIRPDGKITMVLIGEVQAAGLTPNQLAGQVAEKLKKFINSPEVFVSVRDVRSRKYLVSGEVNRPGPYPLIGPVTVVEALVAAGGFREFANKKNIVIIRGKQRIKFNYQNVIKGKSEGLEMKVENGDHIVVP